MQRIGIFMSAREGISPLFTEAAREVGEWIGRTGRTLVYGGSRAGLMEVVAQATKKSGGRVVGVVPQVITQRGMVSECIDDCFPCNDLNDRKAILMQQSDILVALPGGIGTLDELFTVLGVSAIGLPEAKTLVLYNVDGIWDGLIAMLRDLMERNLVRPNYTDRLKVACSVEELEQICA